MVGPKPLSAKERADRFYEDKMAAVFRRARQLLHPAGRMVVMFNHKETWAWRSLGMALIRAGSRSAVRRPFTLRPSRASISVAWMLPVARAPPVPAARGNRTAGGELGHRPEPHCPGGARAAERFQKQGLTGTDLYLSALGPALGEVGRNWPVTDFAGRQIDLAEALDEAYKAVGRWRLEHIFADLTLTADLTDVEEGFSVEAVDRDTQTLWLWLDTFQGETAHSDDVRKLAKSLNVDPNDFKRMGLLSTERPSSSARPKRSTCVS